MRNKFTALLLTLLLLFLASAAAAETPAGTPAVQSVVIFAILAVVVYAMVSIGGWGVGEVSMQGMTLNELIEKAGGLMDMLGSGMF